MPKGSVTMRHNSFSLSLCTVPPPGSPGRSTHPAYLRVVLYYIDLCKMICEESTVKGMTMAEMERRKRPSHYIRIGGQGRGLMARAFPPIHLSHYSSVSSTFFTGHFLFTCTVQNNSKIGWVGRSSWWPRKRDPKQG